MQRSQNELPAETGQVQTVEEETEHSNCQIEDQRRLCESTTASHTHHRSCVHAEELYDKKLKTTGTDSRSTFLKRKLNKLR